MTILTIPQAPTLEHPLPAGMRDLLPPEASLRRAIARAFLGRAELFGYEFVIPPIFEYAHTIERGLGTLDPREIVRFVEPETGEVVALRPDVTPQIARLVSTRFEGKPPPYRLAYDASVLRRRAGSRARTHRQIAQLGVELIGVAPLDGDLELLVLAATALAAMGLPAFTIDLGHAEIARSLLADVEPSRAAHLADALAKKDVARIETLAVGLPTRDALVELPALHGDPTVLSRVPEALSSSPARGAIDQLRGLVDRLIASLESEGVRGATISVDLSEVRGLAYYTGPFYQLFAEGPGVAIGAGGRYDQLLSRFSTSQALPASGLALDVDALLWALRLSTAKVLERPRRVIVTGEGAEGFARALRASGVSAAVIEGDAAAYARAWGYELIACVSPAGVEVSDAEGRTRETIPTEAAIARLSASS
ncbi:MAG: ATP phosphoribosyltransferase regulatory subunit [Deltaproteobacteria bacterium]|nr:ATP phosphoribosyltransferase regulatory subunit [Deltaproteobacteria bacterium]